MTFSKNSLTVNMKANDQNKSIKKEPICMIMELENEAIQFIELDVMLDSSGLRILDNWLESQNETLLKIANEYEIFDRQFYHFMYDVIGLSKAISSWNIEIREHLLNETKSALTLLHNRVQAEIYSEYSLNDTKISLFPTKDVSKKPDLQINNTFVDVKAILLSGGYKPKLLKHFLQRLKDGIIEKEKSKNQIGESGTFFITVWSGIISSIIFVIFNKMKHDKVFTNVQFYDSIPPFTEDKIIFVLPSPNAFQNYYLVMPRKKTIRIMNFMVQKGLTKIQKSDPMYYLTLINIRKGCPFGLTGNNPMIDFKLT